MPAEAHTTTAFVWQMVCRRDFDLTPRELGTLAAIAAYVQTVGRSMPRAELERLAELYPEDVDMRTPGVLHDEGLIKLEGGYSFRYYSPTQRGLERLRR